MAIVTSWSALVQHLDPFVHDRQVYCAAYRTLHIEWSIHKQAILVVLHDEDDICRRVSIVPFSNEFDYDNRRAWTRPVESLNFVLDGRSYGADWKAYYAEKAKKYGIRESIREPHSWWLNGHLLCNTTTPWSLRSIDVLRDMVESVFLNRPMRSVWPVFVINRRDFPHLGRGNKSPFSSLPWAYENPLYEGLKAPVVSFYTGPRWDDRVWPTPQAWSRAAADLAWPSWPKRPKAIFRGTLTGKHMGPENVRLQLVALSFRRPDLLDAGLTSWSPRDRIDWPLVTYAGASCAIVGPLEPVKQAEYAIVVYAPGHVAAERLDWCLRSGSCVVVVNDASCVAPLQFADVVNRGTLLDSLTRGVHYVEATIEDLEAVLENLLKDLPKCAKIGLAGKTFADTHTSRASMMDHMYQSLLR